MHGTLEEPTTTMRKSGRPISGTKKRWLSTLTQPDDSTAHVFTQVLLEASFTTLSGRVSSNVRIAQQTSKTSAPPQNRSLHLATCWRPAFSLQYFHVRRTSHRRTFLPLPPDRRHRKIQVLPGNSSRARSQRCRDGHGRGAPRESRS